MVIPARYASSRLPGKPLVDLAGKSMIARVYSRVLSALPTADIVVATDDERIASHLRDSNIPFAMTNPRHESGTDRVAEVAVLRGLVDGDLMINVQGDEPLVPVDLLQRFLSFCQDRPELQMATISAPVEDLEQLFNANVVKLVTDRDGIALMFSRSTIPYCRDKPESEWPIGEFQRHIGIYSYRVGTLRRLVSTPPCMLEEMEKLEQLRAMWLGIRIGVLQWSACPPHGVDTPADVERVTRLIQETEPT